MTCLAKNVSMSHLVTWCEISMRNTIKGAKYFRGQKLSRAETFAIFRDFGPISRKLMPGKKLNEKFAKVVFAKNKLFQKLRKFFRSLKKQK